MVFLVALSVRVSGYEYFVFRNSCRHELASKSPLSNALQATLTNLFTTAVITGRFLFVRRDFFERVTPTPPTATALLSG